MRWAAGETTTARKWSRCTVYLYIYMLYRGDSVSHCSPIQYDTTMHATMIFHAVLTSIHSMP